MEEEEIERHKKEAANKIDGLGNSHCQYKLCHFLKSVKIPIAVAFIFCNLSDGAGDLLEIMNTNSNLKSMIIFGNRGYPDHLDSWHDLQQIADDGDDMLETSQTRQPPSTDKKLIIKLRKPNSGSSSKTTRRSNAMISGSEEEGTSYNACMTCDQDQAVVIEMPLVQAKRGNLVSAYTRLIHTGKEVSETWFQTLQDTDLNQICSNAKGAQDKLIEAEKKLGDEPIENPSVVNALEELVNDREDARQGLINAAQKMHTMLETVILPVKELTIQQYTLQNDIIEVESVLVQEARNISPPLFFLIQSSAAVTLVLLGIAVQQYPRVGTELIVTVLVLLLAWSIAAVIAVLASNDSGCRCFSHFPLYERLVLSALMLATNQSILGQKIFDVVPNINKMRDLGDLFRTMIEAKACLESSINGAKKEVLKMDDLREKVDNICSAVEISRHLFLQEQLRVALKVKEELRKINRDLVENKKLLGRINAKFDDFLVHERNELLKQKQECEKRRADLKQQRRELDTKIKRSSGTTDTTSGNIRCWFPELFLAAKWIGDVANDQEKGRGINEAIFELIRADLKLDVDEDEVTTPPQEIIGNALAGRSGVQCKQYIDTNEIKVWKIIPWPTVDKDAEECLRRLKRALCHSRRVPHANILPCEGAIVRTSPTDGRVDSIALQFAFQRGGDFQRWLERPRSLGRRVIALGKVADALRAMHRIGLPHRDIKPMNIVMSSEDDHAEPFLTDFEESKLLDGSGLVTHRSLRSGGIGTVGFMAPELANGVPSEMTENTAETTNRWLACDVYSFAVTIVRTVCDSQGLTSSSVHMPNKVLKENEDDLRQSLESLLDVKELIILLKRALDGNWANRPAMVDLAECLSTFNCTLFASCNAKNHAKNGLLCPSGNHFICKADFALYISSECNRPIGDRRAAKGKFTCPHRGACTDKPFSIEALRMYVDGAVFEAILRSEREIIQAEEAAAARQREDELRRSLAQASTKELTIFKHRTHITDEIATSRCPQCNMGWYDFSGCCALTCGTCQSHFCAFCTMTSFPNKKPQVFRDGQECHMHVAACQDNPKRGEHFCSEDELERTKKRLRAAALQEYFNRIEDAQLLVELRQDPSIRMILSDVGLL